jgi:hypothetical protein
MTTRDLNNHYLRTTGTRDEPRRYPTLVGAQTALDHLIELQRERRFNTIRAESGKHISTHPDGRSLQIWIENELGSIVS